MFSSYKTFEGGNFICVLGTQRRQEQTTFVAGEGQGRVSVRQDATLGGRFTRMLTDSQPVYD